MSSRSQSVIPTCAHSAEQVEASATNSKNESVQVDLTGSISGEPKKSPCPVCGGSSISLSAAPQFYHDELRSEDLRITDLRYGLTLPLLQCTTCEFLFADSQQVLRIPQLYAELQDTEYSATQDSRVMQMKSLLALVRMHAPGAKTLLDVGAGSGLLVREAGKSGLEATGVEPSEWLVKEALTGGTKLFCGTLPLPQLAGKLFDVVTAIDVIEHVAQPSQFLLNCMQQVAANGVLVLATPDVGSFAARLLRQRWWHFRLAHIGYFKKRSLLRMFSDTNLEPICWARAKWFFHIRYIAERLERYLPGVRAINRMAAKIPPLRWIYSRVVCLNLHDSYVVIVKRRGSAHGR